MTVCGLWVDSPEAEAKAPNTVEALTVDFGANGSLEGTINVTAPKTAFDGSALSEDVNIEVKVDGTSAKKQTVKAGENLSFTHNFGSEGQHKVVATASNAVGGSPEGAITVFCGQDTPVAPSNVELAIDETGKASLSWDAVTKGINGGYIDASQVVYNITRQPDNTVVAENFKETTFTEQLPEDVKRYSYSVEAIYGGKVGEATASNSLVWGSGLTVPFETKMGDEAFFNLCTVIDNDEDGYTFYTTWGSASASVPYGPAHQADDWMITPPIYLEPGVYYYTMTFGTRNSTPHSMKFTMGQNNTIEAQTEVLADYPAFTSADGTKIKVQKTIVIKKAGKYYFGANHYSKTDGSEMPYCSVYEMSLKQGPTMNAPQTVTDLSGETYPKGELKNKLTFTTPTKDFNEATLESLTKVEVEDEMGAVVATTADIAPGKTYTIDVENAKQGINTYYVSAYNQVGGKGAHAEVSVYAGNDLPAAVTNPAYTVEDNLKITFNWNYPPEKGINGGYVDQKTVTYNIGRNVEASYDPISIKTGLTERTFTIEEGGMSSEIGDKQNLYLYSITPVNELGEGQMLKAVVLLGKPYQAPFKESFQNAQLNSDYWGLSLIKGLHSWNVKAMDEVLGIEPQDEDAGMAVFSLQDDMDSQEAITTPLFALEKMKNPVLSFYMYHSAQATNDAMLSVQISKEDANYVPLANTLLANDGTTGWQQHKMSLSKYNESNRLIVAFLGASKTASSVFAIDKIEIYDDVETDLALTGITAPASIGMNEGGELTVNVENKGRNDIAAYVLDLYADGYKVGEFEGGKIAASEATTAVIKLQPTAALSGKSVNYEVRVNLDGDANDLNDVVQTTVNVLASKLPAPTNLTGTPENGKVVLAWNVPAEAEQTEVSDSFEDYTAYAIDGVGNWKFVDGDGQLSNAIANVNYDNATVAKSFQVWKTEGLTLGSDAANWGPRTGSQCLINFSASGYYPNRDAAPNAKSDDWMISPRAVGSTTVKFYASEGSAAYGNETFEFMVSYDSQDTEDFGVLETVTLPGVGWKEYSFDLPTDARYFAIHCITEGGFALLIDDITFTSGYSGLELQGYNVYRDNLLVNEELISELSFEDEVSTDATIVYGVSAVYDQGESPMVTWTKNGAVESVSAADVVVVGADQQILVKNAVGKTIRVFNAGGLKIAERSAVSSTEKIGALQGVYVVTVDSAVYKVIVK